MLEELLILLQIIFIDIILAADNAIIIGLIAANFAPKNRKQIILWGVAGALIFKIIFASGYMVAEALVAADLLSKSGIKVSVANMHTLKPFDTNFVMQHTTRTGVVVTAENHSVIGGLGSAVAEVLAEDPSGASIKFKRIGIADTFAEGGTTNYLFNKYGLSASHISDAVLKLLNIGKVSTLIKKSSKLLFPEDPDIFIISSTSKRSTQNSFSSPSKI